MSIHLLPDFRIVVVDDEDYQLRYTELLIRKKLPSARRRAPDLLITDLRNDNVPGRKGNFGMSGFEMLQLLAEARAPFPVLIASGSLVIPECAALAKDSIGSHLNVSYLPKPFSAQQFWGKLEQLLTE